VEEELGNCWTVFSFILGCITSIISGNKKMSDITFYLTKGFIGMKMAVLTNVRVTRKAVNDIGTAFDVAFRGGAVMGFCLVSLGLLMLTILIMAYKKLYLPDLPNVSHFQAMFECIAGYGLGGSSIALFGRVGGGIYTKAADVGADLVGKIEENLEEDSPMNPGVIADNVGDNVGDIAGMGSDLFGSFAESSCAALVVSGTSEALTYNVGHLYFPLLISASGIFVGIITAFFATHIMVICAFILSNL
jgi:H+-translocating diphosphatase